MFVTIHFPTADTGARVTGVEVSEGNGSCGGEGAGEWYVDIPLISVIYLIWLSLWWRHNHVIIAKYASVSPIRTQHIWRRKEIKQEGGDEGKRPALAVAPTYIFRNLILWRHNVIFLWMWRDAGNISPTLCRAFSIILDMREFPYNFVAFQIPQVCKINKKQTQ